LEQLAFLTGKNYENWDMAYEESPTANTDAAYTALAAGMKNNDDDETGGKKSAMSLYILR
jgi:hypothetical protein